MGRWVGGLGERKKRKDKVLSTFGAKVNFVAVAQPTASAEIVIFPQSVRSTMLSSIFSCCFFLSRDFADVGATYAQQF